MEAGAQAQPAGLDWGAVKSPSVDVGVVPSPLPSESSRHDGLFCSLVRRHEPRLAQ
jgi:hypothetical protein